MNRGAPLLICMLAASGGCSGPGAASPALGPSASAAGVTLELAGGGSRIEIKADRLTYSDSAGEMRFSGDASVTLRTAGQASGGQGESAAFEARAGRISVGGSGAQIALAEGVRARFSVPKGTDFDAGF